jgi:DNA-directed RNA polymerase specialized sigma24 family protein
MTQRGCSLPEGLDGPRPPHLAPMRPFEQIVDEHSAEILLLCRQLHAAAADAENAWTAAFLAAMVDYPQLPLPARADPRRWLIAIARGTAGDGADLAAGNVLRRVR